MAPTPGALVREARGCPSRSVSILRAPQTSPARRGRHALELPPTPASPRLGHRGKGRSPPEAHVQPEPLPPRPSSPAAAWLRRPPCWTPRLPWAPALHAAAGTAVLTRSFAQAPVRLRSPRCLHVERGTDETRPPPRRPRRLASARRSRLAGYRVPPAASGQSLGSKNRKETLMCTFLTFAYLSFPPCSTRADIRRRFVLT